MNITVESIESFLLILVRLSAFIFTAPIFSNSQIPRKVKACFSVFISMIIYNTVAVELPAYSDVISFAILVMQEAIVGLILGFIISACMYIVNCAGRLIDMEMGLSMANMMDPSTRIQASITGAFYTQMVLLLLLITNMHYYILRAIVDSFKHVPLGGVVFHAGLYEIMQSFLVDFFVIGFRIVLPVFAAMLIVNVVLGVLARIAPQMNMFVVGMQLKIFVGLVILYIIVSTLPMVSDFIAVEMKKYINIIMKALAP
mgnify:CR=1 FL=1